MSVIIDSTESVIENTPDIIEGAATTGCTVAENIPEILDASVEVGVSILDDIFG